MTAEPWTGPKADPEIVAAAKAFQEADYDDKLDHLASLEWAPTSPAQIVVALSMLAGYLDDVATGRAGLNSYQREERNRLEAVERRNDDLERRLRLLEQGVLRRDHFDARIDELEQAVRSNA